MILWERMHALLRSYFGFRLHILERPVELRRKGGEGAKKIALLQERERERKRRMTVETIDSSKQNLNNTQNTFGK